MILLGYYEALVKPIITYLSFLFMELRFANWLWITIFFCSVNTFAQCKLTDLFQIEMGSSQFQVVNLLHLNRSNSNIIEREHFWCKPSYLAGDSVFRSNVSFSIENNPCFDNGVCTTNLEFSDQKLYKQYLRVNFKANDFNSCINSFNKVVSILKEEFPDSYGIIIHSAFDDKTQIGEGFTFYKAKTDSEYYNKNVDITYTREYEYKLIGGKQERTGKIYDYILEIKYTNLKFSKLDERGCN